MLSGPKCSQMAKFDPRMLMLMKAHEIEDVYFYLRECERKGAREEHKKYRRMEYQFRELTDDECWERFRFCKQDISRLQRALHIPDIMTSVNGTKWTGLEGLTLLLRRLNYPKRLSDLVSEFGRHISDCGIIFNEMVYFMSQTWGHLLESFNQDWLSIDNLQMFADAVHNKGCPLTSCFGFIDGSLIKNCRPIYDQRNLYNGKDRVHGLKYQALVTPNGLTANLYGPVEGRRHDSSILRSSGLLDHLENLINEDGDPYVIYADKAYPISRNIITPYKGAALTHEQRAFNMSMNTGRIAVEWAFGKVSTNFSFVKFPANQKVYLQPLAVYYQIATLLTNCHTCLYGSQTSKYFELDPPSLEEYLQG